MNRMGSNVICSLFPLHIVPGGDRLVPINLDHVDHSEGLLILHFDASSMVPCAASGWSVNFVI